MKRRKHEWKEEGDFVTCNHCQLKCLRSQKRMNMTIDCMEMEEDLHNYVLKETINNKDIYECSVCGSMCNANNLFINRYGCQKDAINNLMSSISKPGSKTFQIYESVFESEN